MDNLVTPSKKIKEDKMDNVTKPSRKIKEEKIKDVRAIVTIIENLCIGQENVHIWKAMQLGKYMNNSSIGW